MGHVNLLKLASLPVDSSSQRSFSHTDAVTRPCAPSRPPSWRLHTDGKSALTVVKLPLTPLVRQRAPCSGIASAEAGDSGGCAAASSLTESLRSSSASSICSLLHPDQSWQQSQMSAAGNDTKPAPASWRDTPILPATPSPRDRPGATRLPHWLRCLYLRRRARVR
jgi:hypothetical protein